MTATSRPIASCQICNGEHLASILFLGYLPPVNTMQPIGAPAIETVRYPLELLRCGDCGLVQIGLEVAADVLFPFSYPYLSGTTRALRDNFSDLYAEVRKRIGLNRADLVVDIGSNDGSLLTHFQQGGHRLLGVEPSQAGDVARGRGIDTWRGYFDATTVAAIKAAHGPARVVTAANVFAHIADPHAVVAAIGALLTDDGVFVSESHYLLALIETLQYDTIYHEHLRHYHVGVLSRLLEPHGFEIFHVTRIPTHGGSIRVYAGRRGQRPVDASVLALLAAEAAAGIDDGSGLAGFRERVVASKLDLYALIAGLNRSRRRIYGVGAPSRASTLINYVGLDDGLLDCVVEVSGSHKLGKYIPGTRIPVLDEARLIEDQPEYALLLSWHIADELVANLRGRGFRGRFIVPLPTPRLLGERSVPQHSAAASWSASA
jgi:SAM-dependent methyltransferase